MKTCSWSVRQDRGLDSNIPHRGAEPYRYNDSPVVEVVVEVNGDVVFEPGGGGVRAAQGRQAAELHLLLQRNRLGVGRLLEVPAQVYNTRMVRVNGGCPGGGRSGGTRVETMGRG